MSGFARFSGSREENWHGARIELGGESLKSYGWLTEGEAVSQPCDCFRTDTHSIQTSIPAAIASISTSSTSVTTDIGKLNTVPRQAHRILRLAASAFPTPNALTPITSSVT